MNVGAETTPDSIKKLKALEEREIKRLKKIEAAIQEATKLDEEDLRRKVRNEDPSDDGSGLVQSSLDLSTSNSAA
jgi:hypothetical protein